MVGSWFGLMRLHDIGVVELAKPRQFGTVLFIPEGFSSDGWLRYHWNRITLRFPQGEVKVNSPDVTLRLATTAPNYEHVRIRIDSISVFLNPKKSEPKKKREDSLAWEFPDVQIPLKILVNCGPVKIDVANIGTWKLDSLQFLNPERRNVLLALGPLHGPYLAKPAAVNLRLNWANNFLEFETGIRAGKDSLWLYGEAPLKKLDDLSGQVFAQVENPQIWSPKPWPNQIPTIGTVQVKSEFSLQLKKTSAHWSIQTNCNLGAYQFLPSGHLQVDANGDWPGNPHVQIQWKGDQEESIFLDAVLDTNRKIDGTAKIQNLSMPIGAKVFPLDASIEQLHVTMDSATAKFTTAAGSHLSVQAAHFKDLSAQVQATISPTEPWAYAWCNGNLISNAPAHIDGEYHRGIFTANLQAVFPFAYKATAEHFETDLMVSSKGVYFDNGNFISHKIQHFFTGEVVWDKRNQHYQFEIEQNPGGVARVFGDFDGHISVNVSKLSTLQLPLADTTMLRGIDAVVTGNWEHRFANKYGVVRLNVETMYKGIPIEANIMARQNQDSLIVENLLLSSQGNELRGSAFLLMDSSVNAGKPVLQHAEISTDKFSLVTLLRSFGDSTLSKAEIHGDFYWDIKNGIEGKLSIPIVNFRGFTPDILRVERLQILGNKKELVVSARLHYGKDGLWDNEAEISLKDIFQANRAMTAAVVTDNQGIFWVEGVLDTNRVWKGNAHLEGNWFLPGGNTEIRNAKFHADLVADSKQGLSGLQAVFALDTATLTTPSLLFPMRFKGSIANAMLALDSIFVYGADSTRLQANVGFDLKNMNLESIHFSSPEYHLRFQDIHRITIRGLQGAAQKIGQEMLVSVQVPEIVYRMKDKSMGDIYARLRSNLSLHLPLKDKENKALANSRLEGRLEVERFTYDKKIDLKPDLGMMQKLFAKVTKTLGTMSSEEANNRNKKKAKASHKGGATELDLRIVDPGRDTLIVRSDVATFPFTLDIQVQGTTDDPLLNGDLNSVGTGFVGLSALSTFDLQSLRVSWQDASPLQGMIDIQTTKDVPMCKQNVDGRIDICTVSLDINGPLTKPNPMPSASCAVETNPAQIYYGAILLGCFPEETGNSIDRNVILSKMLGSAAKMVGGQYLGDVGLHWKFLEDNATANDSNYVRIPIKLDRWVKNLNLVMGYTENTSTENTDGYTQSYELGLKYSMPVLDSGETFPNHVDPTLDFSSNLVARRNPTTITATTQESRVEKNLKVEYSWKFWNFCLFGFGFCDIENSTEKKAP